MTTEVYSMILVMACLITVGVTCIGEGTGITRKYNYETKKHIIVRHWYICLDWILMNITVLILLNGFRLGGMPSLSEPYGNVRRGVVLIVIFIALAMYLCIFVTTVVMMIRAVMATVRMNRIAKLFDNIDDAHS